MLAQCLKLLQFISASSRTTDTCMLLLRYSLFTCWLMEKCCSVTVIVHFHSLFAPNAASALLNLPSRLAEVSDVCSVKQCWLVSTAFSCCFFTARSVNTQMMTCLSNAFETYFICLLTYCACVCLQVCEALYGGQNSEKNTSESVWHQVWHHRPVTCE